MQVEKLQGNPQNEGRVDSAPAPKSRNLPTSTLYGIVLVPIFTHTPLRHQYYTPNRSESILMESSSRQTPINTTLFRRHRKFTIFFSLLLLILLLLVFSSTIFSPSVLRKLKSLPFPTFTPSPNRSYCRLTPYEDLCHDSISSSSSTDPSLIFSSSIRFAINELNTAAASIAKAQSSIANASHVLSNCLNGTRESIMELNTSLDIAVEFMWLTYEDTREMKIITKGVQAKVLGCLGALKEEKENLVGVEEVKMGVEKATKCVWNMVGLLNARESILIEFHKLMSDDLQLMDNMQYYYGNDYVFSGLHLVWLMYGAMYVFIALLYFLFWRM